jgi:dihydroneopterin aldolase
LIHQTGTIPLYAELLKENHPLAKDIVEDVFCILARIRNIAGVVLENLVGILRGEDDLVISAAVDILLAVAEYQDIHRFLKTSGAITVIVDLMRNGNHDIIEKVTGAIAQLSYEEYIRKVLMEVGAIPILLDLVHGHLGDLSESTAAEALISFS